MLLKFEIHILYTMRVSRLCNKSITLNSIFLDSMCIYIYIYIYMYVCVCVYNNEINSHNWS